MQAIPRTTFVTKFFAVLFAFSADAAFGAERETVHPYKMTLESKLVMDLSGKQQTMDAHTELEYSWKGTPTSRSLVLDGITVKSTTNGKESMNSVMSRKKFIDVTKGKTTEFDYEDAPPALQTILKESFGVPLLNLQIDGQGKETSRTVTALPGAKDLLDNGVIANGMLFHPTVPDGKTVWQSDSEMSMGNGGYAKGKLVYKKMEGRRGDVYAVTGTLINDNVPYPGTQIVIKGARYVVTGEQTYDTAQKEWASGKLKMEVGFEMTENGKTFGTAKGSIVANLETRK